MKKLFCLLCSLISLYSHAQTPDAEAQLAASYFAEAEAASKILHLWNTPLYGRIILVEPVSRTVYANMADSSGVLKKYGEIYKGVLPGELMLANTAVRWAGSEWSVVLWPLPLEREQRVSLLLHESFHRIQYREGFPQRGSSVDYLGGLNGRYYFLLELNALKAALKKPVNRRSADLKNALVFRNRRFKLFPGSFSQERLLEMNEGLAEYTGVMLSRKPGDIRRYLYRQIDGAGLDKSMVRSSAYLTGPVYGLLLFEKSPYWSLRTDRNADFPQLIRKYYRIGHTGQPSAAKLRVLARAYDGPEIAGREKNTENLNIKTFNHYTKLFSNMPVITLNFVKMSISFNPKNLFSLDRLGMVYPTGEIRDSWGYLSVSSGGMLIKDWKMVSLPVDLPLDPDNRELSGKGWKLSLADGWKLFKIDELHYRLEFKRPE